MLSSFEYILDQNKKIITQLVRDAVDSDSSIKVWLRSKNYYACHNLRKIGAFYLRFMPHIRSDDSDKISVLAEAAFHKNWTIN